jgi:polar amino acid transport system substrate-binding protein
MRGRLTATLAVVAGLALLGACAKSGGGTTTGATTGGTTTGTTTTGGTTGGTTTGATTAPPQVTTLKEGTLTVGSCLEYKPFEYRDKDGKLIGFDVEITEEIAKRMGLSGVTWVKAPFNTIFTALATGQKFDAVAAASTIKPDRLQIVDFSNPYYNSRQSFTVNETETPDIKSTDDLTSSDTIGVQKGTTGKDWAEENLGPKGIQIRTYDLVPNIFTDLEAGRITGIINDEPSSLQEAQDRPGLKVVEPIDTNEHYGIALDPNNPTLKPAVDAALQAIIADGTYKQLFTKYFPTLPLPPEFEPTG